MSSNIVAVYSTTSNYLASVTYYSNVSNNHTAWKINVQHGFLAFIHKIEQIWAYTSTQLKVRCRSFSKKLLTTESAVVSEKRPCYTIIRCCMIIRRIRVGVQTSLQFHLKYDWQEKFLIFHTVLSLLFKICIRLSFRQMGSTNVRLFFLVKVNIALLH